MITPNSIKQSISSVNFRSVAKTNPTNNVSCGRIYGKMSVSKEKLSKIILCPKNKFKCKATSENSSKDTETVADILKEQKAVQESKRGKVSRPADSTDAISSALTRRFGIAGGLGWLGFLTFGVVSEQFKTRRETYIAERDTVEVTSAKEVTTASGMTYLDKVVGGGERPETGLLVGLNYILSYDDKVILDTSKRPQIVLLGRKPYKEGLCAGTDEAMRSMRAGGRRIITVPPELAFGDQGALFGEVSIPPNATVTYDLSITRVSIAPS
mmetsp:Transcript_1129/g.1578  ORF Transcript_1129/g.1578 Transcript_1129/m.1578 type:complete len:269 (-) Transcript_1129:111-917(-)|eukprot:CAMPEP_0196591180 /NCGR_PEP_ID=MMETSP1081-20130531/68766_1 /TAXON_ID=36882 /ORGANISM="Pyramimonas amylifera, Strain CCMP720" /LENGTH=268 /DNA_ID=CAMNT_0041914467 /DNA_START=49 /DNA_END=855 /DNA_ORIENTATION=+